MKIFDRKLIMEDGSEYYGYDFGSGNEKIYCGSWMGNCYNPLQPILQSLVSLLQNLLLQSLWDIWRYGN